MIHMLLVVSIICCGLVIIWVFACTVYYVPQGTFLLFSHPFSSMLSTMHSTNTSCQHCYSSDFPTVAALGNRIVFAVGAAASRVRRSGLPPPSCCHGVFSHSDAPKKPFSLLRHLSLSVVLKVLKSEVYTYIFICTYLFVIYICINGPESWSVNVFYISNQITYFLSF